MFVLIVTGDVSRRELLHGVRRLYQLENPAVCGRLVGGDGFGRTVLVLAKDVHELNHAHNLVMREIALQR